MYYIMTTCNHVQNSMKLKPDERSTADELLHHDCFRAERSVCKLVLPKSKKRVMSPGYDLADDPYDKFIITHKLCNNSVLYCV